jgi:hypothetical protein
MSALHVYANRGRDYVATISLQHKCSDGFVKETPWLLLHKTGRVDRFAAAKEAKDEAAKSWPAVSFKKS